MANDKIEGSSKSPSLLEMADDVRRKAREFMDVYIEHREAFEKKIKDDYPVIYTIRRMGTDTLKVLRKLL